MTHLTRDTVNNKASWLAWWE